jgi:hypothetical protein
MFKSEKYTINGNTVNHISVIYNSLWKQTFLQNANKQNG